jgi:hypothetical protein
MANSGKTRVGGNREKKVPSSQDAANFCQDLSCLEAVLEIVQLPLFGSGYAG